MIKDAYDQPIKSFSVRVQRQDAPNQSPYWETHEVAYESDMNVISVLQKIAARAETAKGESTTPVAWECGCLEEVCGACTMVINGRVRQSCSALVDKLLAEGTAKEIVLQPMSKFPVVRDLVVERTRIFHSLQKVKAWVPVDTYYDMGSGPKIPRAEQEVNYPLSECMSCGCCMEACPQYTKVELKQKKNESDAEFEARQQAAHDTSFMGAAAISQAVLFNNHPTGKNNANERLDALTAPGGIQICGNSQNCVSVCPKEIPLTTSIARAGRAVTMYKIKKWLGAS